MGERVSVEQCKVGTKGVVRGKRDGTRRGWGIAELGKVEGKKAAWGDVEWSEKEREDGAEQGRVVANEYK